MRDVRGLSDDGELADSFYARAGVDQRLEDDQFERMSSFFYSTFSLRKGRVGEVQLPFGYYANVISIGDDKGIAVSTDSVGTKALIAQSMRKFGTIGIDCVASNVNDVLCVGAEPLTFVDYLGVAEIVPSLMSELAKGLSEGAHIADVTICGGEIAQVGAMLRGPRRRAFDIVGTCVGLVRLSRMIDGADIHEGDIIIGIPSSGVHCNGVSLARRVLTHATEWSLSTHVDDLGTTLGDELLRPTRIYTREVLTLLRNRIRVKGLTHVSGGGLLNLTRNRAQMGYVIEQLPEPYPLFRLIREVGRLPDPVMFTVFNMGIGFCIIVSPDEIEEAMQQLRGLPSDPAIIGYARADIPGKVVIEPYGLVGSDGAFSHARPDEIKRSRSSRPVRYQNESDGQKSK